MPVMPPLHVTRRQGLALLAALSLPAAVSACGGASTEPSAAEGAAPSAPDLAAVVAGEERALISLYDAALASLPAADERRRALLTSLRQQHAEHREALGTDAEGPAGEGSDAGSTGPEGVPVAPGLRDLAAAERKAAKARIRSCVEAEDPELARILAFIAASEASHVPALVEAL